MQNSNCFALGEIVNIKILQEIQDKFCDATGLAAVIVDVDGKPVTSPSNFTDFCKLIRSTPTGLARCMASDDKAGRKAMEWQQPVIYHCHSGLTDLAAPIIVNNEYLGAFLAGQVILPQDADQRETLWTHTGDLGFTAAVGEAMTGLIAIVPENRVKAAAQLAYIMSNYIVEMGVTNITQRQLMSELKAKADLETMLKASELKALQSQVNPHFLFNTLNSIARLAMLEGAEQTQNMVYALSDLLRNNLRDLDQLSTLRDEINSLRDYLLIQKVRFGDRVQAGIDISEDLLDIFVPVMTLQPLVENAIIHGLEPKREGGTIRVSAELCGDQAVVTVADSGVGMSPERVRQIFREEKRAVSRGQTTGLGIINVHKRIQSHFGSEYGVIIDGQPGRGTFIHVRLPFSRSN